MLAPRRLLPPASPAWTPTTSRSLLGVIDRALVVTVSHVHTLTTPPPLSAALVAHEGGPRVVSICWGSTGGAGTSCLTLLLRPDRQVGPSCAGKGVRPGIVQGRLWSSSRCDDSPCVHRAARPQLERQPWGCLHSLRHVRAQCDHVGLLAAIASRTFARRRARQDVVVLARKRWARGSLGHRGADDCPQLQGN